MTLYVISNMDRPNSLELRLATREAHLAYVKATTHVQLRVAGPFLDNDGKMIGSMLVVEADDPAHVAEFVKNDPYGKAGLFQSTDIRAWKVTLGALG